MLIWFSFHGRRLYLYFMHLQKPCTKYNRRDNKRLIFIIFSLLNNILPAFSKHQFTMARVYFILTDHVGAHCNQKIILCRFENSMFESSIFGKLHQNKNFARVGKAKIKSKVIYVLNTTEWVLFTCISLERCVASFICVKSFLNDIIF